MRNTMTCKPLSNGCGILATLALIGFAGATTAQEAAMVQPVTIRDGEYEDRAQFVVQTDGATWHYDRAGGGFSRLIDDQGRDWIAFSKDPLSAFPQSAAAGYRGLGNLVFGAGIPDAGAGHPGFDQCESEIIAPNAIRTQSRSGQWTWKWIFYPDRAEFTMEQAPPQHPWWFLYEGPVGGTFAPHQTFWGTSDGGPRRDVSDIRNQRFGQWQWAYFGDAETSHTLYLVQHETDDLTDTFWYLGAENGGAITASDGMAVFGFGRGPGTRPLFRGKGQRISVGFTRPEDPSTIHDHVEQTVMGIFHPGKPDRTPENQSAS